MQPRHGAEITLTNGADRTADVQVYLGANCTKRYLIRGTQNQFSQLDANQARTYVFEAGKPFSVEVDYPIKGTYYWNGHGQEGMCRQIYTFTPEERAYAIVFGLGESSCGAELYAAEHGGLLPLKTADYLTPRMYRPSIGSDGPWCEAAP